MKLIAPYILDEDYRCKHCKKLPPDLSFDNIPFAYNYLFENFELIIKEFGRPYKISSGYRCMEYNKAISGEPCSVHLFGLALDIDVNSIEDVNRLASIVDNINNRLRMGIYTKIGTFVHIDDAWLIRPRATTDWVEGMRWER